MSTNCRNILLDKGPFSSLLHLSFPLPPFNFKSLLSLLTQVQPSSQAMNWKGKGPRLELKLNLSPPRVNRRIAMESPNRSGSSSSSPSPTSPPSSCLSSEVNSGESDQGLALRYSNSPEATSMVLVGCPRCLMYVMLSENDPRCPKCKSSVLLDFLNEDSNNNNNSNRNNNNYPQKSCDAKKTW